MRLLVEVALVGQFVHDVATVSEDVHRHEHHVRSDAVGHLRHCLYLAFARGDADRVLVGDAERLGRLGVDLHEQLVRVGAEALLAVGHRARVVLIQDAPRRQFDRVVAL
ncbi:hypothetical protein C474_16739, partial [Halogeometricum pallidum JCM 14848]